MRAFAVGMVKGVAQVEGTMTSNFEWRLHPGDAWQVGTLDARTDYTDQKMNTVPLIDGISLSGVLSLSVLERRREIG